jgi:hypothetical protein
MDLYDLVALTLTTGAVRLLPEHLDLFTACDGCAGICGVLGGVVAWALDEDIARGGLIGALLGFVFGVIVTFAQAQGVHS